MLTVYSNNESINNWILELFDTHYKGVITNNQAGRDCLIQDIIFKVKKDYPGVSFKLKVSQDVLVNSIVVEIYID